MSFQGKLEAAQKELKDSTIWKANSNPPLFVLLRKIGVKIRPVHYNTFFVNFILMTSMFGCLWGIFMWFSTWKHQDMPVLIGFALSLFAGILFGLSMAFYYKRSAKKNNLSNWEQLQLTS